MEALYGYQSPDGQVAKTGPTLDGARSRSATGTVHRRNNRFKDNVTLAGSGGGALLYEEALAGVV